jgi:hypothetical protein
LLRQLAIHGHFSSCHFESLSILEVATAKQAAMLQQMWARESHQRGSLNTIQYKLGLADTEVHHLLYSDVVRRSILMLMCSNEMGWVLKLYFKPVVSFNLVPHVPLAA